VPRSTQSVNRRGFLRGASGAALLITPGPLCAQRDLYETRELDSGERLAFQRSRKIALLVGVANYPVESGIPSLRYPVKDVEALERSLSALGYTVVPIKDAEAYKDAIKERLEIIGKQLRSEREKNATLIFYFGGHGWADKGYNFLATADARMSRLASTGLKLDDVMSCLRDTGAKRQMLWLDACRKPLGRQMPPRHFFQSFKSSEGAELLFACKAGGVSYESDTLQHGVFTKFLVDALGGGAISGGLLTSTNISAYVTQQVNNYVLQGNAPQMVYGEAVSSGPFLVGILDRPQGSTKIRVHGSTTIGERPSPESPSLVEALSVAFLTEEALIVNREFRSSAEGKISATPTDKRLPTFEIVARGSGSAFDDLATESADLGASSRRFTKEDAKALQRFGDLSRAENRSEYIIGVDGIKIIVPKTNSVEQITLAQLQDIYSGMTTDWASVGGKPGRIKLYSREWRRERGIPSGTADLFMQFVMNHNFGRGPQSMSTSVEIVEDSATTAAKIVDDTTGTSIGYVGLPYGRGAKALRIAAGSGLPYFDPTPCTINKREYPLSRLLYFYLPGRSAHPEARDFARFVVSEAGQRIVEQVGFVSQNVTFDYPSTVIDGKPSGDSFKTPNVRFLFETGSSTLDPKSIEDLEKFLGTPDSGTHRFILLGYTDNTGSKASNLILSQARADFIKQRFIAHGKQVIEAKGLGQEFPVADNNDEDGRRRNRRVEVLWSSTGEHATN
jgi:phosphate transport system substrate-binding protein